MLLHKRWFVAAYWVVAVLLIAVGGALGSKWGDSQAPTFNNEKKGSVPANGVSHLLYQVFGGVLLALVVAAVFAGVWLLLWVRTRHAERALAGDDYDDEPDTMSVDDVEHMFDDEADNGSDDVDYEDVDDAEFSDPSESR